MLSTRSLTRRSFATVLASSLAMFGCATASDEGAAEPEATDAGAGTQQGSVDVSALRIDEAGWSYDADNDVYYQIGVSYCAAPQATEYESMGIYVPGAYFAATDNGDGTYTCAVNESGSVGSYTAQTAPVVLPVNTAGYSAQAAPTEYSAQGITDYLAAGLVYVYAGCRGRANGENPDGTSFDGGAPWGVTDLKAAVRCLRLNADLLPGDMDRVFTFGHSGGGAQSALMGATGDSSLYAPYLEAIGAATVDAQGNALSDAICGAMCWCPITSLEAADEAYEWMMGQYAESGTRAEGTWTALLSGDLSKAFASYVNELGLVDSEGGKLLLEEGGDGIYTAGTYYDYLLATIEGSLNDFLADTEFPYTPSSGFKADGGFGGAGGPSRGEGGERPERPDGASGEGGPSGEMPSDGGPSGEMPSGEGGAAMAGGPMEGGSGDDGEATTYEDAQSYIDALNEDEEWVTYDASTNTATVASVGAFVRHCKQATKDVGAFDALDRSAAENYVFGTGEQDALHFDQVMARLLEEKADDYAAAEGYDEAYASDYAADIESTDVLGTSSETRQNMYSPLYYLSERYEGFGDATPARHWRIRTGIEQGDTSLTTEMNLALALGMRSDVEDVDFATVWGQGHTTAERTGSSTENLLAWIESCR